MLRRPDEAFEIESRQIAVQTSRRSRKLSDECTTGFITSAKSCGPGGSYPDGAFPSQKPTEYCASQSTGGALLSSYLSPRKLMLAGLVVSIWFFHFHMASNIKQTHSKLTGRQKLRLDSHNELNEAPNKELRERKSPSYGSIAENGLDSAPTLLLDIASAIHETYMSESGGITMITIPSQESTYQPCEKTKCKGNWSPPQFLQNKTNANRLSQRVALFTGAYNHVLDGVSLTLNRLVKYLTGKGYEVLVIAPTSPEPAVKDYAGTVIPTVSFSLPFRPEYRLSLGLSTLVKRRLASFRPTIVHIATPDLLGTEAQVWAKESFDCPVVCSYHTRFNSYLSYYHLESLEPVLWWYMRHFYNKCMHIYPPTRVVADELVNHGISSEIKLWQRGVDTELFSPTAASQGNFRKDYSIGQNEIIVLMVCRLVWEKALEVYRDVILYLESQGLSHRSIIVGEGPAKSELEDMLPNTIFTGLLSDTSLAEAYASSDIFVFPSPTETWGSTTLEAMASAVPVVAANAAGSGALVLHEETGFLASPGNSSEFAQYTMQLIQNTTLRQTLGSNGRNRAMEFNWDKAMSVLLDYYQEAVETQNRSDHVERNVLDNMIW